MPEIYIYHDIGTEEGETSAVMIAAALTAIGPVSQIDVYMNSRGGSVYEALGIYSAFKDNAAKIVMHVTVALSSATFVVMAGDEIEMAENGIFMLHRPKMGVGGYEEDFENAKQQLSSIRASVTKTYADRTKLPVAEVTALMDAQTWMTAAQAKAKGFIDTITPNKTVVAHFDLSLFKNVPPWAEMVFETQFKERKSMTDVTVKLEPGMTYQLGPDGKVVSTPVATTAPPTPPTAAVVPPVAHPVMSEQQIQDLIATTLKAGRDRDREITAVCMQACVPTMAAKFIDDPKITVEMVNREIITVLCARNVPVGMGTGADASQGADPVARYKQEYAAALPMMTANGITEDVYVRSRKHTEGVK
jgi:ATP-dependent protease ClpP protease subunit